MKFSALLAGTIACVSFAAAETTPTTTVTETTAWNSTHTNGRFNNTHGESTSSSSSTGTHTKGRFNNTHAESATTTSTTSTGATTTTKYTSANAAAGPIRAFPCMNGKSVMGLSLGGAGVVAMALLM